MKPKLRGGVSSASLATSVGDGLDENGESKRPFGLTQLFHYEEDPAHPEYGPSDLVALRRLILGYMLCCATEINFFEIAPLLMMLPHADGGFAWNTTAIGLFFTLSGAYGFIASQLMPLFIKYFGRVRTLTWGLCIASVCSAIFPLLASVPEPFPAYLILLVFVVIQRTALNSSFSASIMSIPLKSPASHLGSVTGLAHSAGNITRGVFPIIAAPLFAWSVSTVSVSSLSSSSSSSSPGGAAAAAAGVPHHHHYHSHAHNNTTLSSSSSNFTSHHPSHHVGGGLLSHMSLQEQHHIFPFNQYFVFLFNALMGFAGLFIELRKLKTDAV